LERTVKLVLDQQTFIEYVTERRREQCEQQWFSNDEVEYLGRFIDNNYQMLGHGSDTLRRLMHHSGVLEDLAEQGYGE